MAFCAVVVGFQVNYKVAHHAIYILTACLKTVSNRYEEEKRVKTVPKHTFVVLKNVSEPTK